MPYGLIVLIASTALVAYFDFATEALWITKAVVSGIYLFCFASLLGWIPCGPLIRMFLLVAVSVFIIFYRTYQEAKSGR